LKKKYFLLPFICWFLVHEAAIFVDNAGNTTQLTAINFVRDHPEMQSVIVVSQFFHISRAKLAFRQLGVDQVQGAHCDYYEWPDIYSTFREFFGYYKYLLLNFSASF